VESSQSLLQGLCYSMTSTQFSAFPTIQVVLQGPITFSVSPSQYLIKFTQQGNTYYCIGIGSSGSIGITILGDVFMGGYNVVFDRQNSRIGFGNLTTCQIPSSTSGNHIASSMTSSLVTPSSVTSGSITSSSVTSNALTSSQIVSNPQTTKAVQRILTTNPISTSSIASTTVQTCAGALTPSLSQAVITRVETWGSGAHAQFQAVIEIHVQEAVLSNWYLQVIFPSRMNPSVTSVVNGGSFKCQSTSPENHAIIQHQSWDNQATSGNTILIEIEGTNTANLSANQLESEIVVKVLHS